MPTTINLPAAELATEEKTILPAGSIVSDVEIVGNDKYFGDVPIFQFTCNRKKYLTIWQIQ